MMAKLKKAANDLRKRNIEDAVSYALGHGIRVDILCYLNEGPRSPSELARLMSLPPSKIEHHIKELMASNSIELAYIEEGAGNTKEHFYRAVEIPFFTDQEMSVMSFEERQEIYGLILQASGAEGLAAFRAGKVSNDPLACMAWRWFNLDSQGRKDLRDENARAWDRMMEIEAESANRRANTGEEGVSVVVSLLAHERCRNPARDPARSQVGLPSDGGA
ncbi:MAG: winged helix-turn-helix domain-containing protein [Solirubrobacterales bacterium]